MSRKIVAAALKIANKSDEAKQQEQLEEKVENYIIEVETEIALLKTKEIPTIQQEIKKLERQKEMLSTKDKNAVVTSFLDSKNFDSFISMINHNKQELSKINTQLLLAQDKLAKEEKVVEGYEAILAELKK